MTYEDILAHLRNRPPLLLIQEAHVVPGVRASAEVDLTGDEWYFPCHFPGNPVYPGVLQLEAMSETAALAIHTMDGMREKTSNFSKVRNAAFRINIRPGDRIQINTEMTKPYRRGVAQFYGQILVDGRIACEAEFVLVIPEDMVVKGRLSDGFDE